MEAKEVLAADEWLMEDGGYKSGYCGRGEVSTRLSLHISHLEILLVKDNVSLISSYCSRNIERCSITASFVHQMPPPKLGIVPSLKPCSIFQRRDV